MAIASLRLDDNTTSLSIDTVYMNPALGTCAAQWKVADALVRCWVGHKPKTIKNPRPILWSLHDLTCPYASRHIHIIQSISVLKRLLSSPVIFSISWSFLYLPPHVAIFANRHQSTFLIEKYWEVVCDVCVDVGLVWQQILEDWMVTELCHVNLSQKRIMQCLGGLSSSSLGSSRAMISGQWAALNPLKNDWTPQSRHSNKLPALKRKRVGLCTW